MHPRAFVAGLVVPVAALLVAGLVAAADLRAERQPAPPDPAVQVVVDGLPVRVPGLTATVAQALAAARRPPARTGRLLSVRGDVLDPRLAPPVLWLDGRAVEPGAAIAAGSLVAVQDGLDVVEGTREVDEPVAPPPPPDVEKRVWYAGQPGQAHLTVGATSGQVVRRTVTRAPIGPRVEGATAVGLTFDDGPDPRWTPQVLQILAEEGVPATFCMVGQQVRRHRELARAVVAAGHALCTHTANHPEHFDQASRAAVDAEIRGGLDALVRADLAPPSLFRAPGGRLSPEVLGAAHGLGLRVLDWEVDTKDFERPPAPVLVDRVLGAVHPGSLVLLHDGGGNRANTVAALRPLIQALRARGYGFATPLHPPGPPPPTPGALA